MSRLPSGYTRSLEIAFLGALLVTFGIVTYPAITALVLGQGVRGEGFVLEYAYLALGLTAFGSCVLFYGATRALTSWSTGESSWNSSSAYLMVAQAFAKGRYSRLLFASALAYGGFYAFASGIIVFQPSLSFSEAYHVGIPSLAIATCCGPVGETPEAALYLTQHLGLLLVPVNLLLLFSISWLVGLNASLAIMALRFRTKKVELGWLGGLGAFIGLFTSCPTCAGLAMLAVIGGGGAFSTALFLGPLQTLFAALSLPILVVSPMATTKTLGRLISRGCFQAGG